MSVLVRLVNGNGFLCKLSQYEVGCGFESGERKCTSETESTSNFETYHHSPLPQKLGETVASVASTHLRRQVQRRSSC